MQPEDLRRVSVMVDYLFGRGVSRALPKEGFAITYSRRSGRAKLIHHQGRLFATVKPNGAMAISINAAGILSKSPMIKENYVQVTDDTAQFVRGGRSVFCKFVQRAGGNIFPKSEVVVVDSRVKVLGVGLAVLKGSVMSLFKSGVAVKVRAGLDR